MSPHTIGLAAAALIVAVLLLILLYAAVGVCTHAYYRAREHYRRLPGQPFKRNPND